MTLRSGVWRTQQHGVSISAAAWPFNAGTQAGSMRPRRRVELARRKAASWRPGKGRARSTNERRIARAAILSSLWGDCARSARSAASASRHADRVRRGRNLRVLLADDINARINVELSTAALGALRRPEDRRRPDGSKRDDKRNGDTQARKRNQSSANKRLGAPSRRRRDAGPASPPS